MNPSPVTLALSGPRLVAREPAAALAWSALGFLVSLAGLAAKMAVAASLSRALTAGATGVTLFELLVGLARYGLPLVFVLAALAGPPTRRVTRAA